MVFTVGVKFIDIIKTFGYLVISLYPFWPCCTALHTNFVGFKKSIRLIAISFDPDFKDTVVFKGADINGLRWPGQFFFYKLLFDRILQRPKTIAYFSINFLAIEERGL